MSNRERVLEILKKKGRVSKGELARELNITTVGVGKIIKELLLTEKIIENGTGKSTGGRKPRLYILNKNNSEKILGVYFAPNFVKLIVGDMELNMEEEYSYSLEELGNLLIDNIENKIKKILDRHKEIKKISVVTNGLVDSEKGILRFSPHYHIKNIKFKERWEEIFSKEIFLENDVRAMSLVEKKWGSCRENSNFVVLNFDEGVGGSIFLNDELYYGNGLTSGELGHLIVNRNSLEKCRCGKKGCLETEVSNRAIIGKVLKEIVVNKRHSILKQRYMENKRLDIRDILQGIDEKDLVVLKVIGDATKYVIYALDIIISVINPEKIVLYGEIFQSKKIVEKLLFEIKKGIFEEQNCEIVISKYGKEISTISPFALVD